MEKFVCVNGSDHLQIPNHLLEELSVVHPQDIHMNAGVIFQVAQGMEQSGWIRLPFCNTLLAEALGAILLCRYREPESKNLLLQSRRN